MQKLIKEKENWRYYGSRDPISRGPNFYEKQQENAFLSDASQPAGKKQSIVRGYDV